jgi:glutamate formiminotransferase
MSAVAEMQAEFGKSIQYYMERFSQTAIARAGEVERTSEAANEQANNAMFNPVSSMISMWEKAFREAATLANRNMMAARNSMETAANAASEAVAHAVESVDLEEHEHADKKHGASRRK